MPFADRPHFNLAAFRMPQPNGSIGNFGNTPVGILRHPTWHEWDLTLSRRFPITLMGRKNSGIKLQLPGLQRVQRGAVHQHERGVHLHRREQLDVINSANTGKYMATGSTASPRARSRRA